MKDEENSDVDMSSLGEIDDRELIFASKSEGVELSSAGLQLFRVSFLCNACEK